MEKTTTISGLTRWPGLLESLWRQVPARDYHIGDQCLHVYHNWLRDHIHTLKFARYFDPDPTSFLDFISSHQHPWGFFHEILTTSTDPHLLHVRPEYRLDLGICTGRPDPFDREGPQPNWALVRLVLEADIEYLMVEGVARAWEATGDTGWMLGMLPALERGLDYCWQHPDRFDPDLGLMKRPFTIDTWDFCWGRSTSDRGIDEGTPMTIHYGDNAGLFAAAYWLGQRLRTFGSASTAAQWLDRAAEIYRRTNELCWNGRWYTHQILLQPVDTGGPGEEQMLSLSNTYAINRGLTDHDQAASIIRAYQQLRVDTRDLAVAEWFTLYPPYPQFVLYPAGQYINGSLAPFVAGELATACFAHGFEEYGVDILDRLHTWWQRDGQLHFMYSWDGSPQLQSPGPAWWGAAAVGQALLEGLAGVWLHAGKDAAMLSPRWVAAGEQDVTVQACFPSSGYGLQYHFQHDPDQRTVQLTCRAPGALVVSLLLPPGTQALEVRADGQPCAFRTETIEASRYVVVDDCPAGRDRDWTLGVWYA